MTRQMADDAISSAAHAGITEACVARPTDRPAFEVPDSRDTVQRLLHPSPLAAPYAVTDIGPSGSLADALAHRRSYRAFEQLDAAALGLALARSALVRRRWSGTDGYAETSRPAPSAGARHPHVLVVLANEVNGLPPGPWVLDPDAACLRPSNHQGADIRRALAEVTDALRVNVPPPAVVFTVARIAATLARYPAGLSLLWRDAGALQATVHLAAADIGLGSCIIGTAGALHPYNGARDALFDTGAIAVGARV